MSPVSPSRPAGASRIVHPMKRRWTMRIPNGEGGEHVVVFEAPGTGTVRVFVGGLTFEFHPRDVSKIRRVYLEAQARALQDRGRW